MNDHQSQKTESLEPHIFGSEQRYSISNLFPNILQVTENVHFPLLSDPLSTSPSLLSCLFPLPLVLGIELRSLYMLGKYTAIEPHPQFSIS